MADDSLAPKLLRALRAAFPQATEVAGLRRLSGGASQETWAFDLVDAGGLRELILRRGVGGRGGGSIGSPSIALTTEAELIQAAAAAGVPVAPVRYVLMPSDDLADGFVMDRIAGETIPRKILRDDEYASARPQLGAQCGEIAARIHAIPVAGLPKLPLMSATQQIAQFRDIYDAIGAPRPVFELAFRWVSDHAPSEVPATLVHGDFRNGNLIVDRNGVAAVLDWELAHLGDPMEDLGWICVNSWRFGEIDSPVGGFGTRDQLFASYERVAGRAVDAERVKYWEVLGTLKWGVMCLIMYGVYQSGLDRSVERAAIGRRTSETEIDLLELIAGARA